MLDLIKDAERARLAAITLCIEIQNRAGLKEKQAAQAVNRQLLDLEYLVDRLRAQFECNQE